MTTNSIDRSREMPDAGALKKTSIGEWLSWDFEDKNGFVPLPSLDPVPTDGSGMPPPAPVPGGAGNETGGPEREPGLAAAGACASGWSDLVFRDTFNPVAKCEQSEITRYSRIAPVSDRIGCVLSVQCADNSRRAETPWKRQYRDKRKDAANAHQQGIRQVSCAFCWNQQIIVGDNVAGNEGRCCQDEQRDGYVAQMLPATGLQTQLLKPFEQKVLSLLQSALFFLLLTRDGFDANLVGFGKTGLHFSRLLCLQFGRLASPFSFPN